MFDILKGDNGDGKPAKPKKEGVPQDSDSQKDEKPEKKTPLNVHLSFPKGILKPRKIKKEKEPEDHSLASKKLISTLKKHGVDSQEKASELYENTIEVIKTLLEKTGTKMPLLPYMSTVYELLSNIFNQLVLGDAILKNVYEEREEDYYLPYHITNVLILSSFLGIKMGFNKSRMKDLGLACIFCDVGLDNFQEIVSRPVTLSQEEYDTVKKHISYSLNALEKIGRVSEMVKDTVGMHHERVDGSGYPRGLKSNKINPYAKIIGLVDTYEAIAHKRSYREGMNAHKTIKLLLSSLKTGFDHDAMKLLIDKMSIYPIGTIVKLDTEEIARVIGVKPGSPLRPVVMVIQDSDGNPVKERMVIDLSLSDHPSIIESI